MTLTIEPAPTPTQEALCAFWAAVARRYPQARTGDLSIQCGHALARAAENAIAEWIRFNVPPPP